MNPPAPGPFHAGAGTGRRAAPRGLAGRGEDGSGIARSGGPLGRDLAADLAAASRVLADQGVVDAFGHVSIRHPAAADRFWIPRSMAPALVMPDDLMEFTLAGVACDGDDRPAFLERFIHGEIYRARADVNAVVHSHSPSVIPFGLTRAPLRAMFHNAGFLAAEIPVFDIAEKFGATDMLVGSPEKGVELARVAGTAPVVLMRGHGLAAVGPDLRTAVFRAVYTEVNARIQHQALALGGPLAALSPEEGALADAVNLRSAARAWEYWMGRVGR
jgi:HCOMODA/2-hydroxy-3-carboxy-muconic semialdehyde decarboxylase